MREQGSLKGEGTHRGNLFVHNSGQNPPHLRSVVSAGVSTISQIGKNSNCIISFGYISQIGKNIPISFVLFPLDIFHKLARNYD